MYKAQHYMDESPQYVTAEKLIAWAKDAIANGEVEGPEPATVEEAIALLHDQGDLTIVNDDRPAIMEGSWGMSDESN